MAITKYYILRGDAAGETWIPRFTYHGLQFVELTGLPEKPGLDAATGLVLHNDTPFVGDFQCSDEVLTRFALNARWTQRANFVELPTDCPQRDGDRFELDVVIPANTTATVNLPSNSDSPISESGSSLAQAAGVKLLRREGERAVIEVESGRYRFESRL